MVLEKRIGSRVLVAFIMADGERVDRNKLAHVPFDVAPWSGLLPLEASLVEKWTKTSSC